MVPNTALHCGGIYDQAAQVVCGLQRRRVLNGALSLDHDDALEVLPLVRVGQFIDLGADCHPPCFLSPMTLAVDLAYAGGWCSLATRRDLREERFDLCPEDGMIVLECERILRAGIDNCGGNLLLASHRVDGDGRTAHVDHLQQLRDGGDLVRLRLRRELAEHEPLFGHPRADHVEWTLP